MAVKISDAPQTSVGTCRNDGATVSLTGPRWNTFVFTLGGTVPSCALLDFAGPKARDRRGRRC